MYFTTADAVPADLMGTATLTTAAKHLSARLQFVTRF
jgi:hypothetical protein